MKVSSETKRMQAWVKTPRALSAFLLAALAALPAIGAAPTPPPKIPATPEAAIERFLAMNAQGLLNTEEAWLTLKKRLPTPSLTSKSLRVTGIRRVRENGAIARIADATPGPEGLFTEGYALLSSDSYGWYVRKLGGPDSLFQLATPALLSPGETDAGRARRLRVVRLALGPDADLLAWFGRHRNEMETLRRLWKPMTCKETFQGGVPPNYSNHPMVFAVATIKDVTYVDCGPFELTVTIAMTGGDKVYFMYSPVRHLENVSQYSRGWIESLGDDWYFVRESDVCGNHSQRWYCAVQFQ